MPASNNKDKLERKIVKRFRKALSDYRLIEDGDKILVGLSGGKDSLCLLEMLGRRAMINKPEFSVEAIHIKIENINYESDTAYLCSWYRRKTILRFAQESGCNKIALGHHMDDIIHTALMNTFYQGRFSTMPASLKLNNMPLTIISPLCLVAEADIRMYAEIQGYEKQLKRCPHERETNRTAIGKMFEELEKTNPEIRYSVWNALEAENKLIE